MVPRQAHFPHGALHHILKWRVERSEDLLGFWELRRLCACLPTLEFWAGTGDELRKERRRGA
jgi:hypothetical protein